jgi:single-strand DNA-binding protein
MNTVALVGVVVSVPEQKETPGGAYVLKFRLCTVSEYIDKSGAQKESKEFHSITVWGPTGKALAGRLSEGSHAAVEGSLHTHSYEKDGQRRYTTEVKARAVSVLSPSPSLSPSPTRNSVDEIPF